MTPDIIKSLPSWTEPERFVWFDLGELGAECTEGQLDINALDVAGGPMPYPRTAFTFRWSDQLYCAVASTMESGTNLFRVLRPDGEKAGAWFDPRATSNPWGFEPGQRLLDPEEKRRLCAALTKLRTPAGVREYYVMKGVSANRKRVAKGKKPLYDWHTVVIEPAAPEAQPMGGHHASPRPHDRRGHYRTYKSGRRVWVRNTKVGKGGGFVFKDYLVKT